MAEPSGEEISESELERHRLQLRERWELASVLHFLNVFRPVIGKDFKFSAEEIETALIKPNTLLSDLHIKLLKGIPPAHKALNGSKSPAWVTALCKKLASWWPWVANGENPLTASDGKEISNSIYLELDPTTRLLILKALCELRTEQDDAVSYVNDELKNGAPISYFRKDSLGEDGVGTTFWYDKNELTGHRLYSEAYKFEAPLKHEDTRQKNGRTTCCCRWQTLATNLDEFQRVADKLSSSGNKKEATVGLIIQKDAIPVLEKLQKKKEIALKRQQRQEMRLNAFRHSCRDGYTRSSRTRKPVCYTYDAYDRAIKEAIQVTMKRKASDEPTNNVSPTGRKKSSENGSSHGSDAEVKSGDNYARAATCMESDGTNGMHEGQDDDSDDNYDGEKENNSVGRIDLSSSDEENDNQGHGSQTSHPTRMFPSKPVGSRRSNRLAGLSNHANTGANNRLRQRPTRNTAFESIVPDSEDENENSLEVISSGSLGLVRQSASSNCEY